MGIKKTLTNVVCSALAAMAMSGTAQARMRAEFSAGVGFDDLYMRKGAMSWHELKLGGGAAGYAEMDDGKWILIADADLLLRDTRSSAPQFRFRNMDGEILLGSYYKIGKQLFVGGNAHYSTKDANILDEGFGDNTSFSNRFEGKVRDSLSNLAVGHRWTRKDEVSDSSHLLVADFGSGNASETSIEYGVPKIPAKRIQYSQAGLRYGYDRRWLVIRDYGDGPEECHSRGFNWMEFQSLIKLAAQFGGYRNVTMDMDLLYFYPFSENVDFFGRFDMGGVFGSKPDDMRNNGDLRLHYGAGFGFRARRS